MTRGEVESIRGIKCDRVIDGLVKRDLIKEVGRSNGLGRPILYGTTDEFLKYMDIESIDDLPELEELDVDTEEFEQEDSIEFNQISMSSIEK